MKLGELKTIIRSVLREELDFYFEKIRTELREGRTYGDSPSIQNDSTNRKPVFRDINKEIVDLTEQSTKSILDYAEVLGSNEKTKKVSEALTRDYGPLMKKMLSNK